MKTLIITSDFSEEAKNATEYAIGIAKKIGAKLVLFNLHVVSVHAFNSRLPYKSILKSIDAAKTKVENKVEILSKTHGIDIKADFSMGNFYSQLKRAIKEHQAEMVVMGMNVKTLDGDLLGSTTTEAIHKIKTPILAVPLKAKFNDIHKILFACDLTKGVTLKVLEKIKKTTGKFNAELNVFHVDDKVSATKNDVVILESLKDVSFFYKRVQSESVIDEIKKEMIHYKPEILIMVPFEYGFWSSLIHKSKTRMMSSGLDVPLLSIHA